MVNPVIKTFKSEKEAAAFVAKHADDEMIMRGYPFLADAATNTYHFPPDFED